MKFGQLLRQLRLNHKPKKLPQEALGNIIGSTRQYIDAIEKNKAGTPPPKFDQCLKLADLLTLTGKERENFLWQAFKERIRLNYDFYTYLHNNESTIKQLTDKEFKLVKDKDLAYTCVYGLEWNLKSEVPTSDDVTTPLKSTIDKAVKDAKLKLTHFAAEGSKITLTIEANATTNIADLSKNLQSVTNLRIKEKLKTKLSTASIFDKQIVIWTIGATTSPAAPKVKQKTA